MCKREINKRMVFSNLMGREIQGLALAKKDGSGFCLLAGIHIDGVWTIGFCCQRVWYDVSYWDAYQGAQNSTALTAQVFDLYVYVSVHRWSILIIVQRDATQSSLFIILQVHSTYFGCQPQPSSGVHKTVTTASGSVQPPRSNVATLEGSRCTKNMNTKL